MMNWKLAVSAVTLSLAIAALPQDVKHAPTLQSCVGDINLWSSQIPGFPEPSYDQTRSGTKSLTMREIDGRTKSIAECVSAYPMLGTAQSGRESAALTLTSYYDGEKEMRYFDFLVRHGMLSKFNEEDEAGQR